jgi:hypothetical protein
MNDSCFLSIRLARIQALAHNNKFSFSTTRGPEIFLECCLRIDPRLERPSPWILTGDFRVIGFEFATRFPKILSSRKLEKDTEGRGRSRGGKGGIIVVGEISEACARARSLIERPVRQTGELR